MKILTRRIDEVIKKAADRPKGYVEDVKSHCLTWEEKYMYYTISQENWDLLCRKYRTKSKVKLELSTSSSNKQKMAKILARTKEKDRMNLICKQCNKLKENPPCPIPLKILRWKCGNKSPICPEKKF